VSEDLSTIDDAKITVYCHRQWKTSSNICQTVKQKHSNIAYSFLKYQPVYVGWGGDEV